MRLLTCGSRSEVPSEIMQNFDGVFAGYFWDLWSQQPNVNVKKIADKYGKAEIWSTFLYGNNHQSPDPASGTSTIEEWVKKRVSTYSFVTHWNLINEFINDRDEYNPYPNYQYEDIKKYLIAAKLANPNAKFIISDFRPYQLDRWRKIKSIIENLLSENVPIDGVGIQVHFKTSNAHSNIPGVPFILDALPKVIDMFSGLTPVHLTEVSGWRHYTESPDKLIPLWDKLLVLARIKNVESICPWWLNETDENYPRKMPSFEEFLGSGIYDKDWNQRLRISV